MTGLLLHTAGAQSAVAAAAGGPGRGGGGHRVPCAARGGVGIRVKMSRHYRPPAALSGARAAVLLLSATIVVQASVH